MIFQVQKQPIQYTEVYTDNMSTAEQILSNSIAQDANQVQKVKPPRKRAKKAEQVSEPAPSNAGSDSAISQPIQVPVAKKEKKPTAWNLYVKQHLKKGVSMTQVSEMYAAERAGAQQ